MRNGPDEGHTYLATFRLLSYPFAVRTASPSIAALVDRTFGAFRSEPTHGAPTYEFREDGDDPPRFRLGRNGEVFLNTDEPEQVLEVFAWEVMDAAIRRCDDRMLVHAGAVARAGSAVVLPAASGSGKTTLVAGLVAAGFSYLSDEIAAVLPDTGLIAPFPLGLSVKDGSFDVLARHLPDVPHDLRRFLDGKVPIRAEDIRPDAYGAPAPPRFVVAPRYVAGARTVLEPISRAEALGELVRNAFNLDRYGQVGFELLARVAEEASCYRLTIGDLDAAVRCVGELTTDEAA